MKYMQYTIRSIPDTVDRALRARADKEKVSLNQIALDALVQAAGNPDNHDLDFLFGSWVEDKATDEALADQRAIDHSLWK